MRTDPVATVLDSCVGCGVCGANAHAAVLCPSFYRTDVIHNPTLRDRLTVSARAWWMRAALARPGGARRAVRGRADVELVGGRRPLTLAILALGGEGGGVLADWVVAAAEARRLLRAEHLGRRRRPAHRRDRLLRRDVPAAARADGSGQRSAASRS